MNRNKSVLYALLFFLQNSTYAQPGQDRFACPVDGLVLRNGKETGLRTYSNTLQLSSGDGKILSSTNGMITSITKNDSLINIYVSYKKYFVTYRGLTSTKLTAGMIVVAGQEIGSVVPKGNFYFSISENGRRQDPFKLLNCLIED